MAAARAAKKATKTPAKKKVAKRTTAAKRTRAKAPAKKLPAAQKQAMQEGRASSAIVKRYLVALEKTKKRGRQYTPDELQARIDALAVQIDGAPASEKVFLVQKRLDLETRLEGSQGSDVDIETLQTDFVRVAAEFGMRRGITHKAFREVGVPAAVLKEAGVRG